jgi:hypothetical protein
MTELNKETLQQGLDVLDDAIYSYLQQQIACLFLQHAGNAEIKKDTKKGLTIIQEAEKLRILLNEVKSKFETEVPDAEIEASRNRIGYYEELYSRVTDTVFESNKKYFTFPPRPQGENYSCRDDYCQQDIDLTMIAYFPSFYKNAA